MNLKSHHFPIDQILFKYVLGCWQLCQYSFIFCVGFFLGGCNNMIFHLLGLSNVKMCAWFTKIHSSILLASLPKKTYLVISFRRHLPRQWTSTTFSSRAPLTQIHSNKLVFQTWLAHLARIARWHSSAWCNSRWPQLKDYEETLFSSLFSFRS